MYREPTISPKAIAWALLSQSIWLPLLAIDAHDRWQARVKDMAVPQPADPKGSDEAIASLPEAPVASPVARSSSPLDDLGTTTGHVLSSASDKIGSLLDAPLARSLDLSGPSNTSRARPDPGRRPVVASRGSAPARVAKAPARRVSFRIDGPPLGTTGLGSAQTLLQRNFSNSELLGGVLTIQDLGMPAMPTVARAERARWASSGDPMAPLPQNLREPMRQAIRTLPTPTPTKAAKLQQARVIHVPSTRVSRPTQVPLAVQADGSVDVLSQPDDPGVIEDIREWSSRQPAQAPGTVTPTVVNLQPLPAEVRATPAPVRVTPVASSAPIAPPPPPASATPAPVAEAPAPTPAPAGSAGAMVAPQ
ncbi:hypothetical protein L107_01010 [Cyanobium sp. Copco_Reservoir_LC18]|uniref:hypothetical protein n=1 Tax=Cyanobium sp. Copco_Reservoir_LC18 TaxID=1328305 RepID=UPI001357CCE7|nr:hypothetical protein [Cyanobium sp. Copco_Reservoir_LC18]KAF0655055.1 hypothetical protein L107_01010 [Cyanobium sp. Copco_Reservoir_LC18]